MKKEVAYKDNTISIEDLPFPIVLYPGFYGAFFGFKEQNNDEIVLCSCMKKAINNYIKIRHFSPVYRYNDPAKNFIISCNDFPISLSKSLIQKNLKNEEDIVNSLIFENKLCHECNKATPQYRYCVDMYGTEFVQNYGWYIKKQTYDFGIHFSQPKVGIIHDQCPIEFLNQLNSLFHQNFEIRNGSYWINFDEVNDPRYKDENYISPMQRFKNAIEDEVREKFGYKKIGDAWVNETLLYGIIKSIYPNFTIIKHYRPDFMFGLEIDIFIKELNIGIEYQGIQHFEPIKHWGGQKALKELKERDGQKMKLCKTNNIRLIYFTYEDVLTRENVLLSLKG